MQKSKMNMTDLIAFGDDFWDSERVSSGFAQIKFGTLPFSCNSKYGIYVVVFFLELFKLFRDGQIYRKIPKKSPSM